jgi:hypothetical protein
MDSTTRSSSNSSVLFTPTLSSVPSTAGLQNGYTLQSSTPTDGSLFIIRDVSSGHVISLDNGNVVLTPLSNGGIYRWQCVEAEGFFRFLEPRSNKFLCHTMWNPQLECTAGHNDWYRNFSITLIPEKGFVMSMPHWSELRSIVRSTDNNLQKLEKTGKRLSDGIVWEFTRV